MTTQNDDDNTPRDRDDLRLRLVRRLASLNGNWAHCTARPCRRARRCINADVICLPERPLSPDDGDSAQLMAELRIALRERMAQLGCE